MRRAGDEPRKRDRELWVDLGHALSGKRLQVEPRRFLGRVRDLQDGWAVAVNQEGLVAFAGHRDGHSLHAEQFAREGRGLFLGERRRRRGQDAVDGGLGHVVRIGTKEVLSRGEASACITPLLATEHRIDPGQNELQLGGRHAACALRQLGLIERHDLRDVGNGLAREPG